MKSKNYLVIITIVFCILFNLMGCTKVSVEESELSETIIIDKPDVSSENNSSVEDTTSVEEKPVVSEPTEKPVTSKEETPSSPQVKPSEPSQTTKPETKPEESKPTQNQGSSSSTSGKKVVQRADPETGISWDGVSPIVYTYADGTTGTEKREGATYEAYPGMITTYVTTEKEEYDPHCDHCGKLGGDGTNGTCVRWVLGDVDCPVCGEHVEAHTCHTCDE